MNITINNMVFHIFRSLRTESADTVMLSITLLGEKYVLLPVVITLFGWLAYKKYWHTAWHVLGLGIITTGSIEFIKQYVKSQRPTGFSNILGSYSFPSGHTTLALVFYLGLTFLVLQIFNIKSRKLFYLPAALFITAVGISRLYFGVHWFTDIIGGLLIGTAALILVALSYHRKAEESMQPKGIIITILLTLTLTYSINFYHDYPKLSSDYAIPEAPIKAVSFEGWWQQSDGNFPPYLYNRVGLSPKLLNLQWLGDANTIQRVLLKNGWQLAPKHNWIAILYRVTSVESTEHLPLVSPIYLDKYPSLVFIKRINNRLAIIRLWESAFDIQYTSLPLWVGTIEYAPSTYSWLFRNKHANRLNPDATTLFEKKPASSLTIKTILVPELYNKQEETMILIKPKTLFPHTSSE